MVEDGNRALRQVNAFEVENYNNERSEEAKEHAEFQNAADLLNPLQAGIIAFGGCFIRIHGAMNTPINFVSQVLFIDKR
jgi:hypothetical protein